MPKINTISLQKQHDALTKHCNEMSLYIQELQNELNSMQGEMRYMNEFINYKDLNEEYQFFRKNAHDEHSPELPFPKLTL